MFEYETTEYETTEYEAAHLVTPCWTLRVEALGVRSQRRFDVRPKTVK